MSKKIKQIFVDWETYDIGWEALPEWWNAGDVLTKTDSGAEWATAKSWSKIYDCVVAADWTWDYTTIWDAVMAWNDFIFVRNGTYNETKAWNVYSQNKARLRVEWESKTWVIINITDTAISSNNYFIDLRYTNADFHLKELSFNATFSSTSWYFAYSTYNEECFKIEDCNFTFTYTWKSVKQYLLRSTSMAEASENNISPKCWYYNCYFNLTTTSDSTDFWLFYRWCRVNSSEIFLNTWTTYLIWQWWYDYYYNATKISWWLWITWWANLYLTDSYLKANTLRWLWSWSVSISSIRSSVDIWALVDDTYINYYWSQSYIKIPSKLMCVNWANDWQWTWAQWCSIEVETFQWWAEWCKIKCTTLNVDRMGFTWNQVNTDNVVCSQIMSWNYITKLSASSISVQWGWSYWCIITWNYFRYPINLVMWYNYMTFTNNVVYWTASWTLDMTASRTYWNISGNTMKWITVTWTTSWSTDVYTNNII